MKIKLLLFSLLLITSYLSFSQSNTTDSLRVKDTLGLKGSFFTKEEFSYKGKEQLMYKDIKHLFANNKDAASLNSGAQALKVLSYVLVQRGRRARRQDERRQHHALPRR